MPIDVMEQEVDELLEYLGVKTAPEKAPVVSAPKVVSDPKPTVPDSRPQPKSDSGFVRVRTTPPVEVQQVAQKILHQLKGEPYGSKVPFKIGDKEYMAVLEEHVGGRVPGPHPGISLFEKSASYNDIYNLSNDFCKLIKS